MINFSYTGRDRDGLVVRGSIEALSSDDAALELTQRGIIPIDIVVEKRASLPFALMLKRTFKRHRASTNDLMVFCQQMHTFYKAGVPIVAALKNMKATNNNKYMVKALKAIIEDIEAGHSFANALAKHPSIFPTLLTNIVQVGEISGQLDDALLQVAEYLEMDDNTIKQIKAAIRYPILILIFISVALIILNIFVIPVFAKIFAGFGAKLPLMTRILLGTSNFMVSYWIEIFGIIFIAYIAMLYFINTPRGRYIWDGLKLKIPIFGGIMQRALFARLARCFALILSTNVVLAKGIELTADAADNAYVREHLLRARSGLSHGESILSVVKKTELFPPFILQMLMVGEQTGAIDTMLLYVAVYYEREVAYQLKHTNDLMEPFLLLFIGIIVLVLALGIFLPMWDLPSIVLRK